MFRRRTPDAAAAPDAGPAAGANGSGAEGHARTAGKGRPTPKRSEAEKRRRQPYTTAPTDRRAAYRQTRTRDKDERRKRMAAMRRGEDWALPVKERAPVRVLARNYVDSRRTLSEFYLLALVPFTALLFLRSVLKSTTQKEILYYVIFAMFAALAVETYYHGSRLLRLVRERYPGESTKGLRLYMARRMIALRPTRMPVPVVKPGAKI